MGLFGVLVVGGLLWWGLRSLLPGQRDPEHTGSETRAKAKAAGDAMSRCFEESKRAYETGDRARAKLLSNEGRAHKAEMESLNTQAAQRIFAENNTNLQPGEIDLHGLYVKEAQQYALKAVREAKSRGEMTLRLIVGKGTNSIDGIAKLGPAIAEVLRECDCQCGSADIDRLARRNQLETEVDPRNSGVRIVHLRG